uniref:t-SNARE coiled-coil homology domain-containing protein n=1 Tax=Strombidinopsis acuminata TaxID=141414 RepID=A0A7S3W9G5_9SPIT
MGEVLEESLLATTVDREKAASERLQHLVQETNERIGAVKMDLDVLIARSDEEEKKHPNSAEGKIRRNMQQAMAKKHQQLLLDFQQAQIDYKKALQRRQQREMEILMPEASARERNEMIEAGETPSLVVAKKMAGTHATLLDEVQRIHEKHQDILALERSIADLAQMFQEMAVLVESQGEMLDAIEVHVHNTVGYTAKAEKELVTARKAQHSAQKWTCCLTVFVTIVVIVILGPVLLK